MTLSPPLLTTQALTIGYSSQPRRIIAESLTLNLWPGQLVCLLGPNGAGKSTLMRTLAGLQSPLQGQISVAGRELSTLGPTELAQTLSLVLAERVDAGNLLVSELVALGRTPYTNWLGKLSPHDHATVRWAMQATDTFGFAHRRLGQLSDGERQKVMLARALAQDTSLILLDEPTAHLDLLNRVGMMRLLHRLTRQTQKAILLSTHELDLALQSADQLWLLDMAGKLASGTPEDVVLTGAFEAAFARDDLSFDRTTGAFILHTDHQPGLRIHLSGDERLTFWTRRALRREGFVVVSADEPASCRVSATYQFDRPNWTIQYETEQADATSVQALLNHLQPFRKTVEQAHQLANRT